MACEKRVDRYELWKEWKKNWRGPWLYDVLVLLGLAKSPTFEHMKTVRAVRSNGIYSMELDSMLEEFERIYMED